MKIESLPLSSVVPDSANIRLHDERNLDAIRGSLARFGQQKPIVVDSQGVIRAGNGTYLAAKALGWQTINVVRTDLAGLEAAAFAIADNRTSDLSTFDDAALAKLLEELRLEDALDGVGFEQVDIDQLLADLAKESDPLAGLIEDEVPAPPDEPTTRRGDLWLLGQHRLLCGDSSSPEDVDRLVAGASLHLVNMDPPYNVKVEPRSNNAIAAGHSSFTPQKQTHHQQLDLARHPSKVKGTTPKMRPKDRPLQNDFISDEDFGKALRAWFGNAARVLLPGRGFYIWGGYANCANYPSALAECGLYFSQSIIWVKEHPVLTRKDFMGNHEWCQPAGTQVLTPQGEVPIESLRDGDEVVAYSPHHNQIMGVRHGAAIKRTERPYCGLLLGVKSGAQESWCTPAHPWTVRLSDHAAEVWCVYLMRKGNWWRVGKSKLLTAWGFGLKQRLYTEGGDAAWILSIHESSVDAALEEQIMLAEYGIPLVTWSDSYSARRTIADIRALYDRLNLERMQTGALRALRDFGRELEYPLLTAERTHVKVSRRVPTIVRSCNLLPGVMAVPRQEGKFGVRWDVIEHIDRQPFEGPVYSMDVEKHHHYIADGLVTHNCFYGWKEGAAHQWLGPTNATDVWTVKKLNHTAMVHLTEKPVELAARAIQYSSRKGESVLDLFGGSGSTLIAAEQTGRHAYLMELDEPYTDVIVERWQRLSGRRAMLEGTNRCFDELRVERTGGIQ